MTVDEVKAIADNLAVTITSLVQEFEKQTGCVVHSIPVEAATAKTPAKVRVKVQIGQ